MTKKKKKDNGKDQQQQNLKDDLKEFSHDCEEVLQNHELIDNIDFLHKFAEDIKHLEDDATYLNSDPSAQMVHYYLSTPMGAPFVSTKTLLEAASSYDDQDPLKSDLHNIVDSMIHFGDQKKNPLLLLFQSIEEYLEREDLKD